MCDKRDNKITRWLALCVSLLLFSCDPLSAQSGLAKESPNSIRELNEQTDSRKVWNSALDMCQGTAGFEDKARDQLESLNSLASLYQRLGKYDQDQLNYRQALAISDKALGPNQPEMAVMLNNIGELHLQQGNYEQVLKLLQQALKIKEETLSAQHPSLALGLDNSAGLYRSQGRYVEAESLCLRGSRD